MPATVLARVQRNPFDPERCAPVVQTRGLYERSMRGPAGWLRPLERVQIRAEGVSELLTPGLSPEPPPHPPQSDPGASPWPSSAAWSKGCRWARQAADSSWGLPKISFLAAAPLPQSSGSCCKSSLWANFPVPLQKRLQRALDLHSVAFLAHQPANRGARALGRHGALGSSSLLGEAGKPATSVRGAWDLTLPLCWRRMHTNAGGCGQRAANSFRSGRGGPLETRPQCCRLPWWWFSGTQVRFETELPWCGSGTESLRTFHYGNHSESRQPCQVLGEPSH